MLEPLEVRKLLASISIMGTSGVDVALITVESGILRVRNGGSSTFLIGSSPVLPAKSKTYANITDISADVGGGNDRIEISADYKSRSTLIGGAGRDLLRGGAGSDSMSGGSSNDTLLGNKGNDTLAGGPANDLLRGGLGNDQLSADGSADSGIDIAFGDEGNDSITGGGGGDALYGDDNDADFTDDGADTIRGGTGLDYLTGNGGADQMFGDDGDDFFATDDRIVDTVNGGAGNDRGGFADGDSVTSVELQHVVTFTQQLIFNISVINGTAGDDNITLAQNGDVFTLGLNALSIDITRNELVLRSTGGSPDFLSILLICGAGDDTVSLLTDFDIPLQVDGEAGNDVISGGVANSSGETLSGGLGNDLIAGRGNDGVRDELVGGSGSDTITGGAGLDVIEGELFDDFDTSTYNGIDRTEKLLGSPGNDSVNAAGGNDTIMGAGGDDTVFGEGGNDRILGGNGDDDLFGGSGRDTIYGDAGADFMSGSAENDRFFAAGDDDIDTVSGGSGTADRANLDDFDDFDSLEVPIF